MARQDCVPLGSPWELSEVPDARPPAVPDRPGGGFSEPRGQEAEMDVKGEVKSVATVGDGPENWGRGSGYRHPTPRSGRELSVSLEGGHARRGGLTADLARVSTLGTPNPGIGSQIPSAA